jgi:DNA repair exonuclease SbcCD ATPase subunit
MPEKTQHIIRVQGEAFKRLKVVEFRPNRYGITRITGANGAGKTSAMDLILNGLAPRKTLSPTLIRQGERRGIIEIEINDYTVTRTLDDKGGTLRIVHKATNTLVPNPDDWLETLAGGLGFDPLKFMRLNPNDQFEELKGLVKLDANLEDLEQRNEDDADKITQLNAEAKRLAAARDHITVDTSLPAQPTDVDVLLKEASAVSEYNDAIERQRREREAIMQAHEHQKANLETLKARHEQLSAELLEISRMIDTAKKHHEERTQKIDTWEPLAELKDRRELDQRVTQAISENAKITANNANRKQYDRLNQEAQNATDRHEALKAAVRERNLKIAKTLETAKFPIEGLSFETIQEGSGGRERKNAKKIVTYHGIPLGDCSSAEQIRVSTAIGMAGKPDLRFLLIREGSLLDDSNLEVLEQMAHEHDFQILMETVDTSGKVGIYLEDGEVKAVNAEPDTPSEAAPAKPAKKSTRRKKEAAQ